MWSDAVNDLLQRSIDSPPPFSPNSEQPDRTKSDSEDQIILLESPLSTTCPYPYPSGGIARIRLEFRLLKRVHNRDEFEGCNAARQSVHRVLALATLETTEYIEYATQLTVTREC
jgi:hypothetical protein